MIGLMTMLHPPFRRFWLYGALAALAALAWHFDRRAVANAAMVQSQAVQFKQAQAAATASALHTLQTAQAHYLTQATEANDAYQSQLSDARSAADRYIADHRVRAQAVASGAGTTAASTQSDAAGVPANMPADAIVVSGGDVHACTDAVTYAIKAHDWANAITP